MSSRRLAVAGALLIVLAVPAGAQAVVTIAPLKPCYVTAGTATDPQAERVFLNAAGFTANSKVDVALDGVPLPEASGLNGLQTDASGALGAMSPLFFRAPFIAKGTRDFALTLTEQGTPANTGTATAKTSALGISVKPRSVSPPSKRIRFRGLGFTADKKVYAHYLYGGKLRKTVKMAKPQGPCGSWTSHRPQIPIRKPRAGLWTIQFDQSKRFIRPPEVIYVRLSVQVSLTFHH